MIVEGTDVPFVVKIYIQMISKQLVFQIVEEFLLEEEDLYLVDINISADNRIVVEIDAFEGVSLDACIALNKYIESKFDREKEDFELEVGSAGISEPFKVIQQYQKNIENEVEVLTKEGKKFSGILTEAEEEYFVVEIEKSVKPEGAKRKMIVVEPMTFKYAEIKSTKQIIRFK